MSSPEKENVFEGSRPGDHFVTRSRKIVQLVEERDDNGVARYKVRRPDGSYTYHNAAGALLLNYDPDDFIERRLPPLSLDEFKRLTAEMHAADLKGIGWPSLIRRPQESSST